MKVCELLKNRKCEINENQLIDVLKSFNWKYEFSTDLNIISRGESELKLLENMVYELWKKKPNNAINIWNKYCPFVPEDKTIVPSFIMRLEAQEA